MVHLPLRRPDDLAGDDNVAMAVGSSTMHMQAYNRVVRVHILTVVVLLLYTRTRTVAPIWMTPYYWA